MARDPYLGLCLVDHVNKTIQKISKTELPYLKDNELDMVVRSPKIRTMSNGYVKIEGTGYKSVIFRRGTRLNEINSFIRDNDMLFDKLNFDCYFKYDISLIKSIFTFKKRRKIWFIKSDEKLLTVKTIPYLIILDKINYSEVDFIWASMVKDTMYLKN